MKRYTEINFSDKTESLAVPQTSAWSEQHDEASVFLTYQISARIIFCLVKESQGSNFGIR